MNSLKKTRKHNKFKSVQEQSPKKGFKLHDLPNSNHTGHLIAQKVRCENVKDEGECFMPEEDLD
jgi:hypothetical protein